MASSSHRTGPGGYLYGDNAPYRSREGLSTRPVYGSDEIQLRIDPMNADLDHEITGLRSQVRQLRNVAQDIQSEATFQRDFLDQLTMSFRYDQLDRLSEETDIPSQPVGTTTLPGVSLRIDLPSSREEVHDAAVWIHEEDVCQLSSMRE
ncbi:hypothetical protein JRO89_XS03G0230500 [Xanthoceras sorbifolium]|uniref:Uncharacterized protein n=1 Tax=Xanthoceras sorbifolium TaxID=99658 RepID=A0ABQ8IBC1_9ROSI|nr:hypothetical protein JRO89_XS03G0230500 [Xanthoceras sorbifolium]